MHLASRSTLLTNRSGSTLTTFALLLPLFLMIGVGAADYSWVLSQKSVYQDAADTAALAAAKELAMSDAKRENVESVVKAIVEKYVEANAQRMADRTSRPPKINAKVTDEPLQVEVKISLEVEPLVGGNFGMEFPTIEINAIARVVGQPNVCVLALEPSEDGAVSLQEAARMTGNNCAVYSNSSHAQSIRSVANATLSASFICAAGGKSGTTSNFNPIPMIDCPSFSDPLAGRPEPEPGKCIRLKPHIQRIGGVLLPGTYCGGLTFKAGATLVLTPGTYIIKDGPLVVEPGARLVGVGVGFYFIGKDATLQIADNTLVSLTAPIAGPLAGLLFFESRSQPASAVHTLLSNNAPLLLGTIYLSRGELNINSRSPLAFESAYTAIVARAIKLQGSPHLVLNTNYDKTDIPVPLGIRGAGQPVALVK